MTTVQIAENANNNKKVKIAGNDNNKVKIAEEGGIKVVVEALWVHASNSNVEYCRCRANAYLIAIASIRPQLKRIKRC